MKSLKNNEFIEEKGNFSLIKKHKFNFGNSRLTFFNQLVHQYASKCLDQYASNQWTLSRNRTSASLDRPRKLGARLAIFTILICSARVYRANANRTKFKI